MITSAKRIYYQVFITEVLLDMITEIILAIIALLFLMVGIFLFKGKAAWLIAGYNSLSEEEKRKRSVGKSETIGEVKTI